MRTSFRRLVWSSPLLAALMAAACSGGASAPPAGGAGGSGSGGAPATGGSSGGTGGSSRGSGGAATGSGGTPVGSGGGGGAGSGGSAGGTGGSSAGSGGSPTPGADAAPETTPDSGPLPSDSGPAMGGSEACGKGGPKPAEGFHTLKVDGMDRRFFLRLPPSYDGKSPWPVIFGFHGAGNKDGSWFDTNTGLRKENQGNAVLVFGESLFRPGSTSERSWQEEAQLPANLAYIDAVVDWLKGNVCTDARRLFAAGQSSGAYFSQTLACHRGDVFRAVASSDGGERLFKDCKGNPSAFVRYRPNGLNRPDSERALDFWIARNGCSAQSEPTSPAPCLAITGCKNDVQLWRCVDGGAHDWPAYMDRGVWTFFSRFK